ncbi:MAG TPA: hypothetical protein DDW17_09920 [Deltaproteobacteria bacterium]|nr:hypothetical protein [Deltaproteobacteria bacterium]
MNQEIMILKGQIADSKHRLKELDLEASGLIISIRANLNPYEDDITKLKIPEARVSMKRLYAIYNEMVILKKRVADMEEGLANG